MNLDRLADLCVKAYPNRIIEQIKCMRQVVQDLTPGPFTGGYLPLQDAKTVIEAAQQRAKGD
jgi:hypothetical protein